jgi:type I restriction-modification system DNA methylase subunit
MTMAWEGDELLDFISNGLFKELKEMELHSTSDPKAFLVKAVFKDSYNHMKSGALIRQVINRLNEIDFTASEDMCLFNDKYENMLKDHQSAGNAGEFYTPRPVNQFIIDMLATTNLILHDTDIPKIKHDNSLIKNVRNLKPSEYSEKLLEAVLKESFKA